MLSWSKPGNPVEASVKLRKRLEANFERDIRHTHGSILQHILGYFHPAVGDIFGKGHPSGFLEPTTKIVAAHVNFGSHLVESDGLMDVSVDEVLRIGNAVALFVAQIQEDLVGQLAEL